VSGSRRPRRPGIKATIGVIVEGDTEYHSLPLLYRKGMVDNCPPIKPINLHGVGSHRDAGGIAKLILPKVIQHRLQGRERVIVCIDREQRELCAPALAHSIRSALVSELDKKGRSPGDLHVVVADRCFEAWILADAAGLYSRGVFSMPPAFHSFEGQLGAERKKGTKELDKLLGRAYSKTVDGPLLFRQLSVKSARCHQKNGSGSRSFDKFLRAVGV